MASVAYTLHNVFSIPAKAERATLASHLESESCTSQSEAGAACGLYINLDEQLEQP